jgi:hypothetical protein
MTMVAVGFGLQVLGFLVLAAPWGFPPSSAEYSDPRMPFAPLVFIAGVMLVFIAAVVYELLPEREPES